MQIQEAAVSLTDYIARNKDPSNEMKEDMLNPLYKYALESICKIALDTK